MTSHYWYTDTNMKNSLEGHKFFPVIAWTTVIFFALFVGHMTMQVSAQISDLGERTETLKSNL